MDRNLKRNYILKFESDIKLNPSSFWRYVKSRKSCSSIPSVVFYNETQAHTSIDAANLFADFFCSNFQVDSDLIHEFHSNMNSSINIGSLTFTLSDVEDGIRQLKTSTKSDVDGLSSYLLKNCSAIAYPLLLMFNKSLERGEFIDAWKVTTINPVFKSGNKNNIANYRPIAKLSTVSKLFELIVKEKIYFAVNRYISADQHGFMKGRSTVSNLAVFSEYCISSFKKKTQVDAVYTDFSKAFDKVNHRVLISKLSAIGFHSTLLQWIKSYLSSRKCVVNVDGASSISFIASSGVPQGSILGPLLFILFVNDISSCFNNANFLLYADDLKIYSGIASTVDSLNLQSDLDSVIA